MALKSSPDDTHNTLSGTMYSSNLVWASLSKPHTCGENGKCLYICIYVSYVRIPYIHSALFVHNAIFPHCMLVHVTTVAQDTRLAGQKGQTVGTNVTGT